MHSLQVRAVYWIARVHTRAQDTQNSDPPIKKLFHNNPVLKVMYVTIYPYIKIRLNHNRTFTIVGNYTFFYC